MKQVWKRGLTVLLAVLLLCGAIPLGNADVLFVTASATESGMCGENLTWTLTDDGELTISGIGEMANDSGGVQQPWVAYRDDIKTVLLVDSVTSIGNYAFADCTSLASITIPNSVTSIGGSAFENCTSLASITIPNSVTSIGDGTFENCSSLANITIPDSVTSIGIYAFADCTSLKSITIPGSVTSIGGSAFENCTSLASVTIPDSVTSIEVSPFGGCTSLSSITVDARNTAYCSDAAGVLYNKDKSELLQYPIGNPRTSFAIPDGVKSIGWFAFEDGVSLVQVTIPDGMTSINSFAFSGCTNLTSITIPYSVTSIGDWVFSYCASLPGITVDMRNSAYCSDASGVLYNKDKTVLKQYPVGNPRASFTIPDGVTSIENGAFGGCMNLSSITIPNSMTCIGINALNSCTSLVRIIIPSSVTTIDAWAFSNCTSLKSIVIPQSVTSIGYRTFMDCTNLSDVYYSGSDAQWNAININESGNEDLMEAMIHFNWFEEPIVRIRDFNDIRTVDYRTTITFSADVTNPVDGAKICWFIDGQNKGTSDMYTVKGAKKDFTVQAKYMKDGKTRAESEIETVKVNAGFFARLKAFFRALFGRLPEVVQDYHGVEIVDSVLP